MLGIGPPPANALRRNRRGANEGKAVVVLAVVILFFGWLLGWLAPFGISPP